jgi:hypothetical protein
MKWLVEEKLVLVDPKGTRHASRIAISAVSRGKARGEFMCTAWLEGFDEPRAIYGASGLQALTLALKLVDFQARLLVSRGWRVLEAGRAKHGFPIELVFGGRIAVRRRKPRRIHATK